MNDNSYSNFNLWKMLVVLACRKKFIISLVLVCTIGAVIIALLLPKWYRAKTSILPSQHDQMVSMSGSFAQYTISSAGFDLPIMATPSDVYATMLKSTTIARAVIEVFDLQNHYQLGSFQECHSYLKDKSSISVSPEGIVELYYEDKDPEMAAKIANQFVKELDDLNRSVKAAKARSDREFIYHRLDSTKTMLDSARAKLLAFQKENKAVDLASQKELAISAASELKSQLALTRVSIDVQKKMYSANHPSIKNLENRAQEYEKQLRKIELGDGSKSYLDLPLEDIPRLSIKLAEFSSAVEVQEKVYLLLTELYEDARIKEQKDTPTISVLEEAYPPELKYKPKRSIIVAVTFCTSLMLAVFLSLFADYLENLRRLSPTDYELLNQARKEISGKSGIPD
ncbi:MAG: Wzz/FepE/Etk N-terminal domain-containing protein [candidate division Zixibacteria bacterium]